MGRQEISNNTEFEGISTSEFSPAGSQTAAKSTREMRRKAWLVRMGADFGSSASNSLATPEMGDALSTRSSVGYHNGNAPGRERQVETWDEDPIKRSVADYQENSVKSGMKRNTSAQPLTDISSKSDEIARVN